MNNFSNLTDIKMKSKEVVKGILEELYMIEDESYDTGITLTINNIVKAVTVFIEVNGSGHPYLVVPVNGEIKLYNLNPIANKGLQDFTVKGFNKGENEFDFDDYSKEWEELITVITLKLKELYKLAQ